MDKFLTKAIDLIFPDIRKTNLAVSSSPTGEITGSVGISESGNLTRVTGQWRPIDPTKFVYYSSTEVTVYGTDLTETFELGMKVKTSQSNTVKYFYITNIDTTNSRIRLTGGSDYTVANSVFDNFYVSTSLAPSGFPDLFNFTSTLTASGDLTINSSGTFSGKFRIIGVDCHVIASRTASNTSGTTGDLKEDLPLEAQDTGGWSIFYIPANVLLSVLTPYDNFVSLLDSDLSKFSLKGPQAIAAGNIQFNATFTYLYSHS